MSEKAAGYPFISAALKGIATHGGGLWDGDDCARAAQAALRGAESAGGDLPAVDSPAPPSEDESVYVVYVCPECGAQQDGPDTETHISDPDGPCPNQGKMWVRQHVLTAALPAGAA